MDNAEASAVAEEVLEELRRQPYDLLVQRIGHSEARALQAPSGVLYRAELEAFWDDRTTGNLRVSVLVDDGHTSAFIRPLSRDFIVAPDGPIVGES